jgi:GAF domain-containing protein
VYRFAAGYRIGPAYLEIERNALISPGSGTVIGRAAMTRKVARIEDVLNDALYERKDDANIEGARSMIGVPLMRQGEPVVVIGLARRRVDPFGDREIELATTFAAQAVVAIENARLLNELRQRTTNLTEAHSRAYRSARAADRWVRGATSYFRVSWRSAARICIHAGESRAHLRR